MIVLVHEKEVDAVSVVDDRQTWSLLGVIFVVADGHGILLFSIVFCPGNNFVRVFNIAITVRKVSKFLRYAIVVVARHAAALRAILFVILGGWVLKNF